MYCSRLLGAGRPVDQPEQEDHGAVPRLGADQAAAERAGRQQQDDHDRGPLARRHQLHGDAVDAALRRPRQAHQDQGGGERERGGQDDARASRKNTK